MPDKDPPGSTGGGTGDPKEMLDAAKKLNAEREKNIDLVGKEIEKSKSLLSVLEKGTDAYDKETKKVKDMMEVYKALIMLDEKFISVKGKENSVVEESIENIAKMTVKLNLLTSMVDNVTSSISQLVQENVEFKLQLQSLASSLTNLSASYEDNVTMLKAMQSSLNMTRAEFARFQEQVSRGVDLGIDPKQLEDITKKLQVLRGHGQGAQIAGAALGAEGYMPGAIATAKGGSTDELMTVLRGVPREMRSALMEVNRAERQAQIGGAGSPEAQYTNAIAKIESVGDAVKSSAAEMGQKYFGPLGVAGAAMVAGLLKTYVFLATIQKSTQEIANNLRQNKEKTAGGGGAGADSGKGSDRDSLLAGRLMKTAAISAVVGVAANYYKDNIAESDRSKSVAGGVEQAAGGMAQVAGGAAIGAAAGGPVGAALGAVAGLGVHIYQNWKDIAGAIHDTRTPLGEFTNALDRLVTRTEEFEKQLQGISAGAAKGVQQSMGKLALSLKDFAATPESLAKLTKIGLQGSVQGLRQFDEGIKKAEEALKAKEGGGEAARTAHLGAAAQRAVDPGFARRMLIGAKHLFGVDQTAGLTKEAMGKMDVPKVTKEAGEAKAAYLKAEKDELIRMQAAATEARANFIKSVVAVADIAKTSKELQSRSEEVISPLTAEIDTLKMRNQLQGQLFNESSTAVAIANKTTEANQKLVELYKSNAKDVEDISNTLIMSLEAAKKDTKLFGELQAEFKKQGIDLKEGMIDELITRVKRQTEVEKKRLAAKQEQAQLEAKIEQVAAVQKVADVKRKPIETQRAQLETQKDLAEFLGTSYATQLSIQQDILRMKKEELKITEEEMQGIKEKLGDAAETNDRFMALQKQKAQQAADVIKTSVGVQRDFLDKALGKMFGVPSGSKFQPGIRERDIIGEHMKVAGMVVRGAPMPLDQQREALAGGAAIPGAGGLPPDLLNRPVGRGQGNVPGAMGIPLAIRNGEPGPAMPAQPAQPAGAAAGGGGVDISGKIEVILNVQGGNIVGEIRKQIEADGDFIRGKRGFAR